jgi:hypothetical protein
MRIRGNTMCVCKEVSNLWNKLDKTQEDIEYLKNKVPETYTLVNRYYDENEANVVYVLECKHCKKVVRVPAT